MTFQMLLMTFWDKPTLAEGGLITVRVNLDSRTPGQPLTLHGFKASNTISDVKAWVCRKAINLGWHPLHLDSRPSIYKQQIEEEPKEKKEMDWLSICKHVRFREEVHKENMGREDYYKGCPVSIVKRPKTIQAPLPFVEFSDLGIHGQYELLDSKNRSITVSRIMFATTVQIIASTILLAPNDEIWKNLVNLNSATKYFVVRVSWDKLSYFFLKTLRTSYADIPIVYVTHLDPHHLDLLTFLATPPKYLPSCYGWDLSRDFDDVGIGSIDFLNIRWLGLRPADCENLLSFNGTARSPPGFGEVIRILRADPFLRRKKDRLEALDWLYVFGTCSCGGRDMSCTLIVFDNSDNDSAK